MARRRNGEAADHEYQRHGQNRLQHGAVVYALEEYAADSGNFCHHCLHTRELSLILAAFHCQKKLIANQAIRLRCPEKF